MSLVSSFIYVYNKKTDIFTPFTALIHWFSFSLFLSVHYTGFIFTSPRYRWRILTLFWLFLSLIHSFHPPKWKTERGISGHTVSSSFPPFLLLLQTLISIVRPLPSPRRLVRPPLAVPIRPREPTKGVSNPLRQNVKRSNHPEPLGDVELFVSAPVKVFTFITYRVG